MPRPVSTFGFVIFVVLLLAAVGIFKLLPKKTPQAEEPTAVATAPEAKPQTTAPEPAKPAETPPKPQAAAPTPAPKGEVEITSLLGTPLYAPQGGEKFDEYQAKLQQARAELDSDPENPEKIVWVGRRLGYLGRMNEAIEIYTAGIEKNPSYAPFYRHRGHRYISTRQFDKAIGDLEKAADLIDGLPDESEADGMPNERNMPLTTTGFNVWYHLGLARYLNGDFSGAQEAFIETLKFTQDYSDNLVAVCDWLYLAYRRDGLDERAKAMLMIVREGMDIIENHAYHKRCMLYKGQLEPQDLLKGEDLTDLDRATLAYGLGGWYMLNGDTDQAKEIFEQIMSGDQWAAFGFIAAETELARMKQ